MNNIKKYELYPQHDARQSFYSKAIVTEYEGVKELKSYGVPVAECKNGVVTLLGYYSTTTSRHQKEFFLQEDTTGRKWAQVLKEIKG